MNILGNSSHLLQLFGGSAQASSGAAQIGELAERLDEAKQAVVEAAGPATKVSISTHSASSMTPPPGPTITGEEWEQFMADLQSGKESPLTDKFSQSGRQHAEEHGTRYEGRFVGTNRLESPGYADFKDRQVAMLNAYHFGSELADQASRARAYGNGVLMGDNVGRAARQAADAVEQYAPIVASQFNMTSDVITKDAAGYATTHGFELRYPEFGLLMSVSDDGEITMYDAQGTAFTREEYAVAETGEYIPEMLNDLDDEAAQRERFERYERAMAEKRMDIRV